MHFSSNQKDADQITSLNMQVCNTGEKDQGIQQRNRRIDCGICKRTKLWRTVLSV